jgi:GntR family transcriptional regulator
VSRPRSAIVLLGTGAPGLRLDSPEPLHCQLHDHIAELAATGSAAPGAMLPGEHAICAIFGVSRTVVRQALAQLEDEGVIERVKGKGTFVARPRIPEGLAHTLLGLYDEAAARGSKVRSDVLQQEWTRPEPAIARQLHTPPGQSVLLLRRLRYLDDEPWSLSTTWLPAEVGAWVADEDLGAGSLYEILRRHGRWATLGTRSVEAVVATPEQAGLLGIEAADPLLVLHSLSLDQFGEPLEVFTAYHRGDRTRFEFNLRAQPADPSAPRIGVSVSMAAPDSEAAATGW